MTPTAALAELARRCVWPRDGIARAAGGVVPAVLRSLGAGRAIDLAADQESAAPPGNGPASCGAPPPAKPPDVLRSPVLCAVAVAPGAIRSVATATRRLAAGLARLGWLSEPRPLRLAAVVDTPPRGSPVRSAARRNHRRAARLLLVTLCRTGIEGSLPTARSRRLWRKCCASSVACWRSWSAAASALCPATASSSSTGGSASSPVRLKVWKCAGSNRGGLVGLADPAVLWLSEGKRLSPHETPVLLTAKTAERHRGAVSIARGGEHA